VASPIGVLFGAWLFGERIDVWLIVCLLLLLLALYLNNRALAAARPASAS
jgi:drug/metabolite transporter (DMT)-like permease